MKPLFSSSAAAMVSIVRNKCLLSVARRFSTSSSARQQAREAEGTDGEISRPATSQMGKMTDIGGRNIFNADHDMFREQVRRWMRERLAPLQNSFEENGQPTREIWTEMGEQVSVWIRSVIGFMFSNLIRVCLESLSRQRLEE